ncbi:hypothetical protein K3N28_06130 [Glycomyces sp. TRM65418]|uniref:WXG100-like domain-containing protein n=1 Tax=Glycomyces sp. TRM65418 TaxID=2867006 RepID=UPI001CE5A94C|nr:hypothetical protein [Glycomyces sp. TRM65418]MCC3762647.1 hypothetical protein [Glycomyces sp. TRM65418]QZD56684.1 hypothetical protein K3N28_06090 [Glycomyces sp. TRM65418]
MGLQLPSELTGLLSMLGYDWPESDEEKLFNLAGEWTGMADQISGRIESLNAAARTLLENNIGAEIDAFGQEWEDEESAPRNLADAADPANIINIGLTIVAGVVLTLKIQVIVQLVILAFQIAQAIATAVVTFGASLAQIPIFKTITGIIVDQLIGMAIEMVLNG